jgi:hypothetical protein
LKAIKITEVNESNINPNRYLCFPERRFRLSDIPFYDLFTKVTFLFTIQIYQAEKYQSRFAASILTGDETIMILKKPAG